MRTGTFAMFLGTVLSIWALAHAYVFWRLASVPWVAAHLSRRGLALAAVGLCLSYVVARTLESRVGVAIGLPLEYLAGLWIGAMLLLFTCLLAVDVVTLGGW